MREKNGIQICVVTRSSEREREENERDRRDGEEAKEKNDPARCEREIFLESCIFYAMAQAIRLFFVNTRLKFQTLPATLV